MQIVICGAGEVGRHMAEVLSRDGHGITLIDTRADYLENLDDQLDVRALHGSGTRADVLIEAGVPNANVFISATGDDETNLLAASVATGVGAGRSIACVHHSAFLERQGLDYARHLGIDHLLCPDDSTALAIAQTLRSPAALAVERFARGRIEIQQFAVDAKAPAAGRLLADLKFPEATRLAAIQRGDQAFLPDGKTRIEPGDLVSLIGAVENFAKAQRLFHVDANHRKRVVIMGGTSVAVWLSRALQSRRFSIRLFESDPARCEELSEKLDWVTVLCADPAAPTTLEEEHIEQVDAFVAATDDDEYNILAAARAKSMGVDSAVVVLQRPTYLHLIHDVGVDRAFSPRAAAAAEVQRLLEPGSVKHLATLAQGIADVYQVDIGPDSGMSKMPLSELQFPTRVMVAAIERGPNVLVPGAKDVIQPGDMVVVIGPANIEKQLRKFFAGR